MMEVTPEYLFHLIGKHHVENMVLQAKVADLEQGLAASQMQVKLLMEQLSKPEAKPKEG